MTKEEIIELIKENLTIDTKETSSYQYGGGYKTQITYVLYFDGEEISESCGIYLGE